MPPSSDFPPFVCSQSATHGGCPGRSFVAAFRRWLMAGGGGGPAWPEGMPRELPARQRSREALLNRYEAHTKNCPTCLAVSCSNRLLLAVH